MSFRWFRRADGPREEILVGPIRGELLGAEHLGERARAVAAAQRLAPPRGGRRRTPLLDRLNGTRRILDEVYARLSATAGGDVSPAGEWLLDNFHIIQEHIQEVRASLPPGYYRELPELATGLLAGYPRVYEMAISLISHTEARVDLDNVTRFVGEFQATAPFSLGELWAVPAMVRLGLIESVRRMALRTVERLDELARAEAWAARFRLGAASGPDPLGPVLADFVEHHPPLTPTFTSRLLQLLHTEAGVSPGLERLELWLAQDGITAHAMATQSIERLALTQLMMTNSITSLRAVARLDWRTFVEGQSRTEAILRGDPSGFYARMTFATRDRYRHVVERIAKRSRVAEEAVARAAVALARVGDDETPGTRRSHVGYYLVDEGLPALEGFVNYPQTGREALGRLVHRHPNVAFVGGIVAGTMFALGMLLWLAEGFHGAQWLIVVLIGFLPANDIAISILNQLITALLPPRMLPKLDFHRGGVPPEFRTAVVIPTMFGSLEAVHAALETLQVRFLANREAHLHFAILSDFTDAATECCPGDDAIVTAARDGVRALNARYAPDTGDAFYLFHRPRRWNPQQDRWMGWERKRGKLAEFNRFVRGGAESAFSVVVGNLAPLRELRYVITLDSDTVLPPDAAPDLVGALAHPLNRAEYDPERGRVVRGYGILQPRVSVSLPSAYRSRFAAVYSGVPGVDPYTTAVSDVYQDLYGEGSFTGKGIYDVAVFEQATHGRFPENRLLSHDLIEGNYARTGLVTDVNVYDDYPASYPTYCRRKHRWIRGDWQLLQWLTPEVPGPDGPEPNRLSLLSRWKILDNLRRSTVELAQFLFLVAGWTVLPGSPFRWTVLGLGAFAAPWVVALLISVLRFPVAQSPRAYFAAVGLDAVRSAAQLGLAIVFLPHQAWISADAIVRTLWRLFVSRRGLLEWESASAAELSASLGLRATASPMVPALIAVLVVAAVVVAKLLTFTDPGQVWGLAVAAGPLLLSWLGSPLAAAALGAPGIRPLRPLAEAARRQADRYARLHWGYFDRFVSSETNWLAPDNFQEDPVPVVAMRTSPTNIGLQLLSTVSAHDLGILPLEEMTARLELTFGTLDRMARYRGHFYNWYDVATLAVLEPAYVSTVDSGNLCGHLIALRQACLTLADGDPGLADRLRALGERAYAIAMAMEFGFLLDPDRKLLSIGYRQMSHTLDASSYDLLASEARLASFVAVAKNDIPAEHWFRLGRTLTYASGAPAMVSWSGSMFEYLMPALVMRSFPFTLLDQTARGAVHRQVAYGRRRGVPWGISESAYNIRDSQLTYQYRAFGVPDLALKRGLWRELVVAPYASVLASLVEPERALRNLAELERLAALGSYGFHDAVDYTRPSNGVGYAVVRNYMAHHIGMSLVALTNVLTDRVWQRRFHADPLVRSAELLLHERIPRRLVLQEGRNAGVDEVRPDVAFEGPVVREFESTDTPEPHIALLGRPPFTLMVSHCGGGYSRYQELAVARWRADGTRDDTGQFCYIKDVSRNRVWSVAHQPVCAPADWYRATLAADRVTFHRIDGDIETRTEVAVVPDDAAEVRRVTVTNNGVEVRDVELTSYGEIVLAPPAADRAHPAFSNLFVETEWHAWCTAITAVRRPRGPGEPPLWCVHVVDTGSDRIGAVSCETDRVRFQGRGRSSRHPVALDEDGPLSGTTGGVLDPVFALRTRLRIAPGQSASVAFTTLIATSRERAFEMAGRYQDPHAAQRALDLAATSSQLELRELGLSAADATVFQELAGPLVFGSRRARAPEAELLQNRGAQPRLWANGISGDWPIVLATISDLDGMATLRELLAAHRYWRRRGLTVDVVVLNTHPTTYQAELEAEIALAIHGLNEAALVDQPGGVFVRRRDLLAPADLLMIRATARVLIPCDGRALGRIVETMKQARVPGPDADPAPGAVPLAQRLPWRLLPGLWAPGPGPGAGGAVVEPPVVAEPAGIDFANGFGALTAEGDYLIQVEGDRLPPAPWVNVIANARGGFIVSERGAGFSWAGNSQFFRLTPWHNDPVGDPATDVIYLRDEASGEVWCPTAAPVRTAGRFVVRHAPGISTFRHEHDGIASYLRLGMAPEQPVKCAVLRLTNRGTAARRITVTPYLEWVLGSRREETQHLVVTSFDSELGAIFARNPFDPVFAGWSAFQAVSEPVMSHTADRREFLGRNGSLEAPVALDAARGESKPLSNTTGAGRDPCAALQCALRLAPGETREIVVLSGAMPDPATARQAVAELRLPGAAAAAIAASVAAWEDRLAQVSVTTPEPSFDVMLNRWSLYQTLSCRVWARSGLYQSSGAYGFRDQLQDVMALVYAEPAMAREHLLRAAGRQFPEGDVQHWWHPETGRGIRTRFSDDLAWLPFVVAHYVRVTGDRSVLAELVPFLKMRELGPQEPEIYDLPEVSPEQATVHEHCLRALRRATTAGVHGLPLIGGGDWNDGMNRVGADGRGESVWLAWFLIATLRGYADLTGAEELRGPADQYVQAVERHGWDGAWYLRAFFDDGAALGSSVNEECRIDSLAQSWSVISGAGAPDRQAEAMASVDQLLVRQDARLIELLTPPFDRTVREPGYIKGYLPGVRENGAQYTHAAFWVVLAAALRGDGDRAFEWFQMLNPLTHSRTPADVATYRVEPYVVAADVYTAAGHLGRGGWTWYTGSASWMYRVGLESLLGLTKRGDQLWFEPAVPSAWPSFSVRYRHGRSHYTIVVRDPNRVGAGRGVVTLDGVRQVGARLLLVDDGGSHEVLIAPPDGGGPG